MVTALENGVARITADETVSEIEFEGQSGTAGKADLLSGDVGETELEIRAELETAEGDQQ